MLLSEFVNGVTRLNKTLKDSEVIKDFEDINNVYMNTSYSKNKIYKMYVNKELDCWLTRA